MREKSFFFKLTKIFGIVLLGLILLWVAGINIHSFGLFGKLKLVDQMRTDQSVFFKIDSSDKSVSSPFLSIEDRKFHKELWNEVSDLLVKIPKKDTYKQAVVEVVFKPFENDFLYLETKPDASGSKTDKMTLYNSYLNDHPDLQGLKKQENDDHVLFSKDTSLNLTDSLENYFKEYTKKNVTSVVNLGYPNYFKLYGFESNNKNVEVNDLSLMGTHRFYTYADAGEVYFKIDYFDRNKNEGPDRLNLRIKQGSNIYEYVQGPDDGDETDSSLNSNVKSAEIRYTGAAKGIYEFEIDVSDDIIITGIKSNLSKLVLKNKIKILGGQTGKKTTLYTGEGEITIDTEDNGGIVKLGNGNLTLEKDSNNAIAIPSKRKEGSLLLDEEISSLELPADDLVISLKTEKDEKTGVVEGTYLSLTKASYLDFNKIDFLSKDEIADADFVILGKDQVTKTTRIGWVKTKVTIDLTEKSFDDDLWFLRLKREEDGGSFLLDSISVTFIK